MRSVTPQPSLYGYAEDNKMAESKRDFDIKLIEAVKQTPIPRDSRFNDLHIWIHGLTQYSLRRLRFLLIRILAATITIYCKQYKCYVKIHHLGND